MRTLTQHVADVKTELKALKSLMEEEYKQKQLQRALTLTKSGAFDYFEMHNYGSGQKESSELAEAIIKSFMRGYGYYLPANAQMERDSVYSRNNVEESKKTFRDKITRQIKDLTKREPRLVQDSKGWIIYYS
jgi:hypothetical protein